MTVWIAQRGENYEGCRIIGVFSNARAAIKCALAEEAHFDDHYWRFKGSHGYYIWDNGCDYITVSEYKVDT